MKRIFSMVLTVAMIASVLVVGASAKTQVTISPDTFVGTDLTADGYAGIGEYITFDAESDTGELTAGAVTVSDWYALRNGGTAHLTGGLVQISNSFFTWSKGKFYTPKQSYTLDAWIISNLSDPNTFTGMLLNFSKETYNKDTVGYETYTGDGRYVGKSGVGFRFIPGGTTAEIYAITRDANGNTGYIASGALSTVGYDDGGGWGQVTATDDGNGTMTFSAGAGRNGGAQVFATLKYADAQFTPDTDALTEKYYRSIEIYDANGTLLASTTDGLMSVNKSMAFGARNASYNLDDVALFTSTIETPEAGSTVEPSGAVAGTIGTVAVDTATATTVSVPVEIAAADLSITSAHLKFGYDTSALEYTGFTNGNVFAAMDATTSRDNVDGNQINIQIYNSELANVAATGTLLYLNFNVIATESKSALITFVSPGMGDDFCFINTDNTVGNYAAEITAGAVEITVTPVVVVPTEITLIDGTTYYFHTTKTNVLVTVPTVKTGVTVEEVLAQVATDATYIQILDTNGAVVTTGNIKNEYTIQIVDADGVATGVSYGLAIKCDARSTGTLNVLDYKEVKNVAVNRSSGDLTDVMFAANDLGNNGSVNVLDYKAAKTFVMELG